MSTILTLQLDPASQSHFEALRQLHFPPERNYIAAHVTLFHTLPDTPEIVAELASSAAQNRRFPLSVSGVRSLGKGVAYTLVSPALQTLHAQLSLAFEPFLTSQDRQPLRPHVVIQNKVTPEAARALLITLQATFRPFPAEALGLELFEYLGGPWRPMQKFPFA